MVARKGPGSRGGPGARIGYERYRECLDLLASGLSAVEVAKATGVSYSFLYQVNRSLGGVYRPVGSEYSDRYLGRDERYELARLLDQGMSIREIARRLGRAPSTVSREVKRNEDDRTGYYVPEKANFLAWDRQKRPQESKLSQNNKLRLKVQEGLERRWSPEQIAGRLRVEFPDDPSMWVSHETIYKSIYVYPRGELERELVAHLRSRRTTRRRRGQRPQKRTTIPALVKISDRPPEVEGRLVPGHHEGDLIKGSLVSNSAIGTIVECTSGFLTLIHLPDGYGAEKVAQGVSDAMNHHPAFFKKTLTWDRGGEMTRHATITKNTGMKVYFADPYKPWQRGTNENTNRLLREYFPKGTDLSLHSAKDLQHVADELNNRPRKRLQFRTPAEVLATLIEQDNGVATAT